MDTLANQVCAEQVRSAVQRYWRVLMDKCGGEMEKFYTYDSAVFNPFAKRKEPGRVSATRKEREYFTEKTSFRAEITSPIDVQVLSDRVAVASYTFRWSASNMSEEVLSKTFDKAVRDGRGTQVFVLDDEGNLRIAHEHLSDVWRDGKSAI